MLIIFSTLVIALSFVYYYQQAYFKVMKWAAKSKAPENLTHQEMDTFIGAIGPKAWHILTNILYVFTVLVLGFGTYLGWYLGVLGIFIAFIFAIYILGNTLPTYLDWYLFNMILSLGNRAADYKAKGDTLRESVAQEKAEELKDLYEKTRGKKIRIPVTGEIKL